MKVCHCPHPKLFNAMLVLASFFNPSRNAIICTLFVMIFLVSGSWLQGQVRYLPGQTYFGRNNYIEYIAGGIPIIISAAHDGDMNPASIPTRRCLNCVTVADVGTQDIVRFLGLSLQKLFGCPPHIVINRLHRRKLDANREISEAALGNPEAEQAWREFHQFIDSAKQSSLRSFGSGLYLDIHGHGHDIQRLELGYLLRDDELRLPDDSLNTPRYIGFSSMRNLATRNARGISHSELLRGERAFGSLLAVRGYPSVPSKQDPFPNPGEEYFDGGYNTARHSSYRGGTIDGLQIEANFMGIRDSRAAMQRFADSLAVAVYQFVLQNYSFSNPFICNTMTSTNDADVDAQDVFTVYPQPASETVHIRLPKTRVESYQISIRDMVGTVVFNEKTSIDAAASDFLIPTAKFPSGVYTVEIRHCHPRTAGAWNVVVRKAMIVVH